MKFPEVWKISKVCGIPNVIPCCRSISLTNVISKVQESYAVKWIHEDVQAEISASQIGGIAL